MKNITKIITLVLAVMMLMSVLPTGAFAAEKYDVFLNHGPQGWGSEAWPLQKTQGQPLPLLHTRDDIFGTYGMLPGFYVLNDQRVFIEWNTAYDARTGRGVGQSYYDYYTADTPATLYAIWGYNIQFNADGGKYASTGNGVYLTYVANFNNSNYEDPLTDYQYCMPDLLGDVPTKPGCRRVMYNGNYAYGLLRNDLRFFTWEGPGQNLTIPPVGGAMPWSAFHCVNTHRGLSLEFFAIWEPSITYDANGGSGYMDVDYLDFTFDALWNYEYYTVKNSAYTKSGTYFTGWNTRPDGKGISVAPGTVFGGQMTNSDPITLYAQWADGSTGHTHSYTSSVTKAATCTATGVRTYKCACGSSYTETIAALGHSTTTSTFPATCTADGKTITTCTRCSASVTTAIPALGHNYTTTTTSATCTEEGKSIVTCRRCGDTTTTTTPPLGHTFGEYVYNNDATCTEDGTKTAYCEYGCGTSDTIKDVGSATGHSWSNWTVTKAPTTTAVGEESRSCSVCKTTETQEVPMLDANAPIIADVDNYTITLNGITDIKEIRFAIGTYTTGSEVKAAEKNVTLDASTVAKYTVDGVFTYDLPWVGEYTFWVRTNDGSQYFLYTDVKDIDPYVESYGVKLTAKDYAEDYKDMWIAKGRFNTYNEIKASTDFKYQASANKLDLYAVTTHDFSYTLTDPGDYTVLIRYNDGSTDVIHHTLTVDYPVFIENGLQVTVTNIPDIKIIRTAYGHYESVAEIKAAAGVRNFNTKVIGSNAESYKLQYRDEGEVTLIVEYNNGYKHFYYYNVEQKVPTMVQEGNKVTFGDLDDLYIIRYAPGKYTTSNNIKNAPGSKYLKSDAINENGEIVIDNLTSGRWSFMVQYNDESYNFYVLDIE